MLKLLSPDLTSKNINSKSKTRGFSVRRTKLWTRPVISVTIIRSILIAEAIIVTTDQKHFPIPVTLGLATGGNINFIDVLQLTLFTYKTINLFARPSLK